MIIIGFLTFAVTTFGIRLYHRCKEYVCLFVRLLIDLKLLVVVVVVVTDAAVVVALKHEKKMKCEISEYDVNQISRDYIYCILTVLK